MADKVIANKQDLVSIANAVRNNAGVSTTYNVPQLADATITALSRLIIANTSSSYVVGARLIIQ